MELSSEQLNSFFFIDYFCVPFPLWVMTTTKINFEGRISHVDTSAGYSTQNTYAGPTSQVPPLK